MVMPQKPYMTLGSLRSQILYPRQDDGSVGDDVLLAALDTVRLPRIAERNGGLAAEKDWGRILSLGEQQRIGFARVIVNAPEYVFLDEATSAVDQPMEAHLYGLLLDSGATMVSVAHRASVIPFHDSILDLREDGWSIRPVSAPATDPPSSPDI
jgi:putative ATP-binding cassette transporter